VSDTLLTVVVAYSAEPRQIFERVLSLDAPCTVGMALNHSGLFEQYPALQRLQMDVGVWGRKATLDAVLRDNDRLEVYRPLRVDPKVARRERFVKQGARAAGLFVKNRTAEKTDY